MSSDGTQLGSDIDFVSSYIHHVLGFIGIDDVTFIDSSSIGRDEKKVWTITYTTIDGIRTAA